jgi:hypothetical protein
MKKVELYNKENIPGNKIHKDLSIITFTTQNLNNYYEFNNLKSIYQINVPYVEYYESEIPSNKAVIVVPGGGYTYISYDPEATEAIKFWKEKKDVSIFVLMYRTILFKNNLLEFSTNPYDVFNMNATFFLPFYDLYHTLQLVKKSSKTCITMHGFSAGGFLISSFLSIYLYNQNLVKDILSIVDTSSQYPNSISPAFQNLIHNYTNDKYEFQNISSPVQCQILHYPVTDQTIPQETSLFSESGLFTRFLITFYPDAITALSLLFSNKLFSDGISDPVGFTANYSLIKDNYVPTYLVHTLSDPLIQNTIPNLFIKWLNEKNIPNVKQTFSYGGHGWGMGYAFPKTTTFPENLFPNNFYNNFYEIPNGSYGSDKVNGSYQSSNISVWYQPPFENSNLRKSLRDFIEEFFKNSTCSISKSDKEGNKVTTRGLC